VRETRAIYSSACPEDIAPFGRSAKGTCPTMPRLGFRRHSIIAGLQIIGRNIRGPFRLGKPPGGLRELRLG